MRFLVNDGGTTITALTLDASEAGEAIFNAGANFAGDVGVGTSPSYRLDVRRTDTAGQYAYFGASSDGGARGLRFTSSDNGAYLGAIHKIDATSGSGEIVLATSGTERMRINSLGNVGIGSSTNVSDPVSRLNVRAATNHTTGSDREDLVTFHQGISAWQVGRGAGIRWVGDVSRTMAGISSYVFGVEHTGLAFETGGATSTGNLNPTTRMVIDHNGKVGIGTTSPSAPLTIGSGATRRGSYSDLLIAPGGDNAQIEMWGANTSFAISHFDNDRLGIYSNVSGSWNETRGISIKSNGNVGIGETDPSYKLSIKKEDDVGPSIELIQASDKKVWINNAGATGHGSGRGNRFEINGTQPGHIWLGASKVVLGSSVGDGNEVFETGPDTARAHKPIAAWTHSGTKYYTHLCTHSAYQTTGTILINTNIPGHNLSGNSNMFSFRVTGFWYNVVDGGAIDIVVGAYSGEGDYYNTTLTGTYPAAWKGKVWFATNSNGKVMLILGDNGTVQKCEIAVTDFVQGYINVNPSYATGWTISATNTSYTATQRREVYTRNPGGMQIIDGTARTAIFSSSGSFTVSQSNTFTPIGSLSDFKIDIHVNVGVSDDEGGGNMNPYANGVIQRRINNGTWTTADNTGISNQGGVSCHVEMSPPRVGTAANTDTYMTQQDRYRTKNHSSTFIDRPSLTMGDTLQYRLICNLTSGNHIQVGEPVGFAGDDNYMAQPFGFIVTEFTPWG